MASARNRDSLWASLMRLPDDWADELVDVVHFWSGRHNVPDPAMPSEAALVASWLITDG